MKLSEGLAELKRAEGKLMRMWELRDSIMAESFDQAAVINVPNSTQEAIDAARTKFYTNKAQRIATMDNDIHKLTDLIIARKVTINRKNCEVGLDIKLQEMKYLRIELSKLMNNLKRGGRRRLYMDEMDVTTRLTLGLDDKITVLESKKSKLDHEIQSLNWGTELD